jgi:leucyl aminopeptidase
VKERNFDFDFSVIKEDLESSSSVTKRRRVSDDDLAKAEFEASISRIKSVHFQVWRDIEHWGQTNKNLTRYQCDISNTISNRLRSNRELTSIEISNANKIIDIVAEKAPELYYKLDEIDESADNNHQQKSEITLEIIRDIVAWDKKNQRLKDYEYKFMSNLAEGKTPLTERNLFIAGLNLEKIKKQGFGK